MRWRAAGWVVRAASLLVPHRLRAGWLEEWRAELWHAAEAEGPLVRIALGSARDALEVRRLEARKLDERGRRRETWTTRLVEGTTMMWSEMRVGVRSLLRAPAFTAVAVLTLALGMGGATAIYTLLDRVVLDPLPYPDADRLVRLRNQVPGVGPDEEWQLATGQWVFYNDAPRTLESVGVWRSEGVNVETPSGPQRARSVLVSVEMMDLLGAEAGLGRVITPEDDRPGAPRVALLSEGFWTRSWGADPGVVGRTLTIDGEPVEVVGVLSTSDLAPPAEAGAAAGPTPDVWLPMQIDPAGPHWNSHGYRGLARLAPGYTAEDVERELASLQPRLPELFPQAYSQGFFDRYGFRQIAVPLKLDVVGDMARNLWILLGAVGLVLLIACANVMNLFLARMEERRRELSVRAALGAGRAAIARYLLAESAVLGAAGGVLAVAVAWWGLPALIAAAPDTLPRVARSGMDGSSLLFAAGLSLAVAATLALFPLLRHGGVRDLGSLQEGGRGNSAGAERQRLRGGLVVAQVAMALTLAVGAGLLLESLRRLGDLDPGFEPAGVVTAEFHPTSTDYPHPEDLWALFDRVLENVRAIPGVTSAGMSFDVPLTGAYGCTVQGFEDAVVYQRMRDAGMTTCADQQQATPGYFEATGIPLVEGRGFVDADNDDPSRAVAVISRAYAERFWPGEDPIGKGIAPSGITNGPFYRVVGVTGDVRNESVTDEPEPVVYYPIRPIPDTRFFWPGSQTLVVRTAVDDPMSVFPAVRRAVAEVDPSIPLANVRTLEEVVDASMGRVAFVSLLLEVAAAVALLLSAVGLYGVISYVVSRRTREIGMRMAMGARPGQVQLQIVGQSARLALLGLVLGIALALGTTRVLEGLLFGVEPTHPGVFAGAAALLGAVGLVAAWLPARRAARIDPSEALRAE